MIKPNKLYLRHLTTIDGDFDAIVYTLQLDKDYGNWEIIFYRMAEKRWGAGLGVFHVEIDNEWTFPIENKDFDKRKAIIALFSNPELFQRYIQ